MSGPSALVVGGAGYIGSHMVVALHRAGWRVITFDNLERGHRDAVLHGELVVGDLRDPCSCRQLFERRAIDVVMHFAAYSEITASTRQARRYWRNNVVGTLNLLDAMVDHGVRCLVFSSSSATYGHARAEAIAEEQPQRPISPYGTTKLVTEQALADYAQSHGLTSVSLRYFNAAGADREGRLRERHEPETHLIPRVLHEARRLIDGGDPRDTTLEVYGDDHATPDGTCVRDFVHVEDLCSAHLAAADRLLAGRCRNAEQLNVGSGRGASVAEVIAAVREVTGADVRYRVAPPRRGDPPRLVASAARARRLLGWEPRASSLRSIVASAWRAAL